MRIQAGTWAVLVLFLVTVFFIKQEGSQTQISPVFVSAPGHQIYVELCGRYLCDKESCVIGASDLLKLNEQIIQSAVGQDARLLVSSWLSINKLASGGRLNIKKNSKQQMYIECDFMAAAKRITLGIPLHPDYMTQGDWQALPGIGEKLASAIIADRNERGNFDSLSALLRVRGISSKKLEHIQQYF